MQDTGPSRGAPTTPADSPHSASSAGSSKMKSGPQARMAVAQQAEGSVIPRNSTTRPPGERIEDGSRSKRKNRIIGGTPGSPGRSPSLPLVRPASLFCASISRVFILTACRLYGVSPSFKFIALEGSVRVAFHPGDRPGERYSYSMSGKRNLAPRGVCFGWKLGAAPDSEKRLASRVISCTRLRIAAARMSASGRSRVCADAQRSIRPMQATRGSGPAPALREPRRKTPPGIRAMR